MTTHEREFIIIKKYHARDKQKSPSSLSSTGKRGETQRVQYTLKCLRLANKKTLAEVANVLGVSVRALLRYEQGLRKIGLEQVLTLSKIYDCTAEEIIQAQLNSGQ